MFSNHVGCSSGRAVIVTGRIREPTDCVEIMFRDTVNSLQRSSKPSSIRTRRTVIVWPPSILDSIVNRCAWSAINVTRPCVCLLDIGLRYRYRIIRRLESIPVEKKLAQLLSASLRRWDGTGDRRILLRLQRRTRRL